MALSRIGDSDQAFSSAAAVAHAVGLACSHKPDEARVSIVGAALRFAQLNYSVPKHFCQSKTISFDLLR
jgi:hypothetical protein